MRKVLLAIMTSTLFSTVAAAATPADSLLAPWSGPYGGVPPFDKVRTDALGVALEGAMKTHLDELDAIALNPAAPNFENTIAALERSGRALDQIGRAHV